MKNIFQKAVFAFLTMCSALAVFAQDEISLRIGDPAPPIKYSKWIKGDPVSSFDGDQLYILEFWATWCGPCRAAMPHLSEVQKQYQGKISIIGVNIWEDKKKGQPYENYLPIVEKFVKQNNENMEYALFVDNTDQHMGNRWMKAAGQEGIPSTFIIKGGKIIWIGDPMALDTTLPKLLDGSYNMLAYKKEFEKQNDASQKLIEEWLDATKPIQEALNARDYKRAVSLMEKARTEHPDFEFALNRMKFYTLLNQVSETDAVAFGKKWHPQDKEAARTILELVSRKSNLSRTTYLWAATIYQNKGVEENFFTFHILATVYANGGDFKNAAHYEEKAVKDAEAALEKTKTGTMTEGILNEYKQALEKYYVAVKEKP
jgi:thiol-disulfide isomerase/thioredoxin